MPMAKELERPDSRGLCLRGARVVDKYGGGWGGAVQPMLPFESEAILHGYQPRRSQSDAFTAPAAATAATAAHTTAPAGAVDIAFHRRQRCRSYRTAVMTSELVP